MRKNLLKQLTLALLLTVAMPCAKAQMAHIGDILCEGDLIVSPANYNANTHTAIGVVFYVDNTGQHGWAIALEDAGGYAWGDNDTPLTNYTGKRQAIYDLDGFENTRIVRQNSTNHPAFYAVDFENGWYVPAIGQLNYLYGNLSVVNASLQMAEGTTFGSNLWYFLSSTEIGYASAWSLRSDGELFGYQKREVSRVRGVRNF